MPEKPTPVTVEISTYKVQVKYYQRAVLKNAKVVETLVDEEVEIAMLARTSAAHTALATRLVKYSGSNDIEEVAKIAKDFVRILVVNDKVRDALAADIMACIDIFLSNPAQNDIERFLSGWGFVEKIVAGTPNPSSEE